MSFNRHLGIQRLEEQIYYYCPNLHYSLESKKDEVRSKLRMQLQESVPEVKLEKYEVCALLKSIEKNLQKCEDFGIIDNSNKLIQCSEKSIQTMFVKAPLLYRTSYDDCEDACLVNRNMANVKDASLSSDGTSASDYENDIPLSLLKRFRKRKHKRFKRYARSPFHYDESPNKSQWQSDQSTALNLNELSNNAKTSETSAKASPVTVAISLSTLLSEDRKLEISIDLGNVDAARKAIDEQNRFANEHRNHDFMANCCIHSNFEERILDTDKITETSNFDEAKKDDDNDALSCLISEVLMEPNPLETSRATNLLENINNDVQSNYNQTNSIGEIEEQHNNILTLNYYKTKNVMATNKDKNKPIKGSTTTKKRKRVPKTKVNNDHRKRTQKSDLAKYVEFFSSNCDVSATPAHDSAIAAPTEDFVTSTTQNFGQLKQISGQTAQIAYLLNGEWTNGGICQLISSENIGNVEINDVNNDDYIMNLHFDDFVNYIDNSNNDAGNNVIARVLDGNNFGSNMLDITNIITTSHVNPSAEHVMQLSRDKYPVTMINRQFYDRQAATNMDNNESVTNLKTLSFTKETILQSRSNLSTYPSQDGVLDLSRKTEESNSPSDGSVPIDLSTKFKIQYVNKGNQSIHDDNQDDAHDQSDDILQRLIDNSDFNCRTDETNHIIASNLALEGILCENKSYNAALDMPLLDDDNNNRDELSLVVSQTNTPLVTTDAVSSCQLDDFLPIDGGGNGIFESQADLRDSSDSYTNPDPEPIVSPILQSSCFINDYIHTESNIQCNNHEKNNYDNNWEQTSSQIVEDTPNVNSEKKVNCVEQLKRKDIVLESCQNDVISINLEDDSFITLQKQEQENYEIINEEIGGQLSTKEGHTTLDILKHLPNENELICKTNSKGEDCTQIEDLNKTHDYRCLKPQFQNKNVIYDNIHEKEDAIKLKPSNFDCNSECNNYGIMNMTSQFELKTENISKTVHVKNTTDLFDNEMQNNLNKQYCKANFKDVQKITKTIESSGEDLKSNTNNFLGTNKHYRCDVDLSPNMSMYIEKKIRFERLMNYTADDTDMSKPNLGINSESGELTTILSRSKVVNTVNESLNELNKTKQKIDVENSKVLLQRSFLKRQELYNRIESASMIRTTSETTKIKDSKMGSNEVLINCTEIQFSRKIFKNSNGKAIKISSDNTKLVEITERNSKEDYKEPAYASRENDMEVTIRNNENESVNTLLRTVNASATAIINKKVRPPNIMDVHSIQKDSFHTDLSALELENEYNHLCLDFDDQMEDDVLSLETSCFSSPECEDRYSLLLNHEHKSSDFHESVGADSGFVSYEKEELEGISQNDRECVSLKASTKFKIPKLESAAATSAKPMQKHINASPSKKKIDLNKITKTVQNVCAVPPLTLQPTMQQSSETSSKAFQSRNDLLLTINNKSDNISSSVHSPNNTFSRQGQLNGREGEAINTNVTNVHDILAIFGPNCLPFLVDECSISYSLQHSHQFRDPTLVEINLENMPEKLLNLTYKFMFNHSKLFQRYFFIICNIYAKRKNLTKLLNMIYDCEKQNGCGILLRNIFRGLQACGLNKINACRKILSRSRNKSSDIIDVLVDIIFESDWEIFCDHLERFAEVPHYSFRINLVNDMAIRALRTKDAHLSSVACKCLLTLNPEDYKLVQCTPNLMALLEFMKDGSVVSVVE